MQTLTQLRCQSENTRICLPLGTNTTGKTALLEWQAAMCLSKVQVNSWAQAKINLELQAKELRCQNTLLLVNKQHIHLATTT